VAWYRMGYFSISASHGASLKWVMACPLVSTTLVEDKKIINSPWSNKRERRDTRISIPTTVGRGLVITTLDFWQTF